jgi:hypothetical protein
MKAEQGVDQRSFPRAIRSEEPHDATVDELVELYRAISGEHDDWDDYRAAQVSQHRVVVRFTPTRAYGALR